MFYERGDKYGIAAGYFTAEHRVDGYAGRGRICQKLDFAFLGNMLHDYYNFEGEAITLSYLRSIRKALKPGGVLGVTDHVGIAGRNNTDLHRIEVQLARELLEKAGFVVEAESGLLANPADDHILQVYEETIYRRTDRFLFRVRNPQ